MAFTETASLKNSGHIYKVSPNARKYTLRDYDFEETASGNFQLIRSLDTPDTLQKSGYKLKITIDQAIKNLKVSVTTKNGMQAVQIYGNKPNQDAIDQAEFIFSELIEGNVLVEV